MFYPQSELFGAFVSLTPYDSDQPVLALVVRCDVRRGGNEVTIYKSVAGEYLLPDDVAGDIVVHDYPPAGSNVPQWMRKEARSLCRMRHAQVRPARTQQPAT